MAKVKPYKVGQYLANEQIVFLKVVGVITDGVLPLYAIVSPKDDGSEGIKWISHYECEDQALRPGEPEWEKFRALKPGDVLKAGQEDTRPYVHVLARVNDIVLLSSIPDETGARIVKTADKISEQLEKLSEGEVTTKLLDDDDRKRLKQAGNLYHTSRVAASWRHVDQLALMNWKLVEGDE